LSSVRRLDIGIETFVPVAAEPEAETVIVPSSLSPGFALVLRLTSPPGAKAILSVTATDVGAAGADLFCAYETNFIAAKATKAKVRKTTAVRTRAALRGIWYSLKKWDTGR
jgi:hypothetical protein